MQNHTATVLLSCDAITHSVGVNKTMGGDVHPGLPVCSTHVEGKKNKLMCTHLEVNVATPSAPKCMISMRNHGEKNLHMEAPLERTSLG